MKPEKARIHVEHAPEPRNGLVFAPRKVKDESHAGIAFEREDRAPAHALDLSDGFVESTLSRREARMATVHTGMDQSPIDAC
jgi:hypothetical protein